MLPLIIGGIAAAVGAGAHISASGKNQQAKDILNDASNIVESAKAEAERAQQSCKQAMNNLAVDKTKILQGSIHRFVTNFSKIKPVNFKGTNVSSDIVTIDKKQLGELSVMCNSVENVSINSIVGGVAGTALAVSAVDTLAGGALLGSSGVAIGGLSGGALLGAVAAPIFAVSGLFSASEAQENLEKAKSQLAKARTYSAECDTYVHFAKSVQDRCQLFDELIVKVNEKWFDSATRELERIVKSKKTFGNFWRNTFNQKIFTDEEIAVAATTASLAKMMKALLDTDILDQNGNLTGYSEEVVSRANESADNLDINDPSSVSQFGKAATALIQIQPPRPKIDQKKNKRANKVKKTYSSYKIKKTISSIAETVVGLAIIVGGIWLVNRWLSSSSPDEVASSEAQQVQEQNVKSSFDSIHSEYDDTFVSNYDESNNGEDRLFAWENAETTDYYSAPLENAEVATLDEVCYTEEADFGLPVDLLKFNYYEEAVNDLTLNSSSSNLINSSYFTENGNLTAEFDFDIVQCTSSTSMVTGYQFVTYLGAIDQPYFNNSTCKDNFDGTLYCVANGQILPLINIRGYSGEYYACAALYNSTRCNMYYRYDPYSDEMSFICLGGEDFSGFFTPDSDSSLEVLYCVYDYQYENLQYYSQDTIYTGYYDLNAYREPLPNGDYFYHLTLIDTYGNKEYTNNAVFSVNGNDLSYVSASIDSNFDYFSLYYDSVEIAYTSEYTDDAYSYYETFETYDEYYGSVDY